MLTDPTHPSADELRAYPWFSLQVCEWWKVQAVAVDPLPTPACVTDMRNAYELAATAAGLAVGQAKLFKPFEPGAASACKTCQSAVFAKCECLSVFCVANRAKNALDRRQAMDAAVGRPPVQCKQCPAFKASARSHCLSAQCIDRRAAKAGTKHASSTEAGGTEGESSGKRKDAVVGCSGKQSKKLKNTVDPVVASNVTGSPCMNATGTPSNASPLPVQTHVQAPSRTDATPDIQRATRGFHITTEVPAASSEGKGKEPMLAHQKRNVKRVREVSSGGGAAGGREHLRTESGSLGSSGAQERAQTREDEPSLRQSSRAGRGVNTRHHE